MPKQCWCGSMDFTLYHGPYQVCNQCQTLVNTLELEEDFNQVENESDDLYGSHYWTKEFLERANVDSVAALHDRYLTERVPYWTNFLLKHLLPPATIAEIGCGMGQFPYIQKQCGFKQTAFELSPEICEYGREAFGIDMVCGTIDDHPGMYDCVAMMDLIEHIPDLHAFMEQVVRHVRDDSILFLQTPCFTPAWTYAEMLEKKPSFENLLVPEEHIFLFSKESMRRFLAQYGFTEVTFYPPIFGEHYDMFLVAGRQPLREYAETEINQALTLAPGAWVVRALLQEYRDGTFYKDSIRELGEGVEHFKGLAASLEGTLEKERAEVLRAQAYHQKLLEEDHQTIHRLGEERDSLQAQLDQALVLYEQLRQEYLFTTQQLADTAGQLDQAHALYHQMEDTNRALEQEKELSRQQLDAAIQQIDALTKTLRETRQQVQDMKHSARWKLTHPVQTITERSQRKTSDRQ